MGPKHDMQQEVLKEIYISGHVIGISFRHHQTNEGSNSERLINLRSISMRSIFTGGADINIRQPSFGTVEAFISRPLTLQGGVNVLDIIKVFSILQEPFFLGHYEVLDGQVVS